MSHSRFNFKRSTRAIQFLPQNASEAAGTRNTSFYALKEDVEEVARLPCASFDHEGGAVAMRRLPQRTALTTVEVNTTPHHVFFAKRPTGPLARRCRVCGEHKDGH